MTQRHGFAVNREKRFEPRLAIRQRRRILSSLSTSAFPGVGLHRREIGVAVGWEELCRGKLAKVRVQIRPKVGPALMSRLGDERSIPGVVIVSFGLLGVVVLTFTPG
jgi:hypothetical protein